MPIVGCRIESLNCQVTPKSVQIAILLPATSIPCERPFSASDNIANKKQALLSSEYVDELVCLNGWLKSR